MAMGRLKQKEKKHFISHPPATPIILIIALTQEHSKCYKSVTDWKQIETDRALNVWKAHSGTRARSTQSATSETYCNLRFNTSCQATHTNTHTQAHRWHETSQCHTPLTVTATTDSVRWMKLRRGDSVARLCLHSWGRAAEFMLISWLRHCVPWRGMCHLPCHLSEQERLVALPRGLPSRSSTADAGEGYSHMETDGTYGGQLMSAPGWQWQEGCYTEDLHQSLNESVVYHSIIIML